MSKYVPSSASGAVSKANLFRRFAMKCKPLLQYMKGTVPMLLTLGLIFILIFVWVWGPTFQYKDSVPLEAQSTRVVITLGILLFSAVVLLFTYSRRLKKLEAERVREEKHRDDPALPFLQQQTAHLDSMLDVLHKNLRTRNYIYKLPWYIVIGAENSGKTSLVNRSNQSFTLSSYEKSKNVGKPSLPYKIDWWMGNEAVILDPDGELLTNQPVANYDHIPDLADRMWDGFTGWLLERRSRRPLNGAILTLDFSLLINSTASDRKAYAIVLRNRLRDLIENLGTRLPVYIVVSKIDLLEGFQALFEDLSKEEREAVFGFSFSLKSFDTPDKWLQELDQQLNEFIEKLNDICLDKLRLAKGREHREELFSFTRQIAGFKEALLDFFSELLESDRYSTAALVRGVYFSSVFQEGIPDNTFVQAAAKNYGLPARVQSATRSKASLVYFTRHLFSKVIYPEAGLAGDNIRVQSRKKNVFFLGTAVAALGSLSLVLGWHYYYQQNIKASDIVLAETSKYTNTDILEKIDVTGENLLVPLRHISKASTVYGNYREKAPLLSDLGLYQGKIIGPEVDKTYLELLSTKYLKSLAHGVFDDINAAEDGSDNQLSALRVYRMMEDKTNRKKEIVKKWMGEKWHHAFEGDANKQNELMSHLDYAMDYVETEVPQFVPAIKEKQAILREKPVDERVYLTMKQDSKAELPKDLRLKSEIGSASNLIYKQDSDTGLTDIIESMTTKEGFKDYFVPRANDIAGLALIDQWVVGERDGIQYSDEDRTQIANKIWIRYVNDYISEWNNALSSLEIIDFADIENSVQVLETMTGPEAPIERLINTIKDQTTIYPPVVLDNETAEEIAVDEQSNQIERREAVRIQRRFSNLVSLLDATDEEKSLYEETIEVLSSLYSKMAEIQAAPSRGKAALQFALDRFTLDGTDPIYGLERTVEGLPDPINHQLDKVANETWRVVLIKALEELEGKWQQEVYSFYQEKLASKYPFNPSSGQDVALEDFEAFFSKTGILTTFYNKYLKIFFEENIDALYSSEYEDYLVSTEILNQLDAAWDIQDGFFDPRGVLNVTFTVEPLGMSGNQRRSVMSVDGQLVPYNHGPTATSELVWPNTLKEDASSRISLVSASGSSNTLERRGPWSWFRLLRKGEVNGANSNQLDLSYYIGSGNMRYRITSDKTNNPIVNRLFKNFYLPSTLLKK